MKALTNCRSLHLNDIRSVLNVGTLQQNFNASNTRYLSSKNKVNTPKVSNKIDNKPIMKNKTRSSIDTQIRDSMNWINDVIASPSTVPTGKTTLQSRSEYDNIINDWITTNWLTVDPKIQSKPCHFFIHDKLLYDNLDSFAVIYEILTSSISFGKSKVDYQTVKELWNNEMHAFNDKKLDLQNKILIQAHLREVLKSIFLRFLKNDVQAVNNFNKVLKDNGFQRKIFKSFKSNMTVNKSIIDKVRNLQNLNIKNDFSIIKDRDLSYFPSINYKGLLSAVNKLSSDYSALKIFSHFDYESVLGNKMNDFKNLEKLRKSLTGPNTHQINRFMILTNDREASLEYFRLLKLYKKMDTENKANCCVVLINSTSTEIDLLGQFSTKSYTGKELYYVVSKFNDIYDILESI